MTKQSDTPRVPDLMEAVFDTCYLLFDLIAGNKGKIKLN